MDAAQNRLEDDLDAHMIVRRDGRGRVPATPRLRRHAYEDLSVSPPRVPPSQARKGPRIQGLWLISGAPEVPPIQLHHGHITSCDFGIQ